MKSKMGKKRRQKASKSPLYFGFSSGFLAGIALAMFGHKASVEPEHYKIALSELQKTAEAFQIHEGIAAEIERDGTFLKMDHLSSHQRLLCWVMTHPGNHQTKAKTVKTTWGRFCDLTLYVSDGHDPELPITHVDAPSGRSGLWPKVRATFSLIHKNFSGQFDWIMKADDDTFVNVNSVRQMLANYNPKEALFFGEPLTNGERGGPRGKRYYMGGGGGYIMSSETMERFVKLLKDPRSDGEVGCDRHAHISGEDPFIAVCLHKLNVTFEDTRDWSGMNRFAQHPGPMRGGDWPLKWFWYWRYQLYKSTTHEYNVGCCSSMFISYHYVQPPMMHQYQYLTFKMNPFDTSRTLREQPKNHSDDNDLINYR